jgi:hypothetical protein
MSNNIQKIDDLPSIDEVRKRSQGLALLDAIIMPDWQYRYFSFNCRWDERGSEMMASMRDGSGSEYFLLFSENGAVGKVLDGQSVKHTSSLLTHVPDYFLSFKNESAFRINDVTFYFWWSKEDAKWIALPNSLNSYANLAFLKGGGAYYHNWAQSYYEKSIDAKTVQEVFDSLSVNPRQLAILNRDLTIESLGKDMEEILGVPQ